MANFHDLENPICNAHSMAVILMDRLHSHFSSSHEAVTGHNNYYFISDEDIECLLFATGQLKTAIGTIKKDFYNAAHSEQPDKKLAKAA